MVPVSIIIAVLAIGFGMFLLDWFVSENPLHPIGVIGDLLIIVGGVASFGADMSYFGVLFLILGVGMMILTGLQMFLWGAN